MIDLTSDPILPDSGSPPALPVQAPTLVLHVEVALKETATCRFDATNQYVESYIRDNYTSLAIGTVIHSFDDYSPILKNNVDRIYVINVTGSSSSQSSHVIRLEGALLSIHVYQLRSCEVNIGESDDQSSADGHPVFATATDLPAKSLDGLWDTLIFEQDAIKTALLNYISSMMLFSDHQVNHHIVTMHRLVLLHGPPGTGKTSLCRALAQKLAIRLSHRYSESRLIEVNATSLFSRFFSESSKLVTSLFEKIGELTDDEESYVCVLIDEIESLTTARKTTIGSEPSDAMRVVNVLLTQLDRLRHKKNILVLTTSNLVEASDPAFLDRADIIQYIGNPGLAATYQILQSCLTELMRTGIIEVSSELQSYNAALLAQRTQARSASSTLLEICATCVQSGLPTTSLTQQSSTFFNGHCDDDVKTRRRVQSGRALRRLPLLAHAQHIQPGSGIQCLL